MANTKTKTEIFEELSPKYFNDTSAEAVIKFLNDIGFNITTLDEMTDDMVQSLYNKRPDLLKFARANGLHNKPVPKVSPDEEKLYFDDCVKKYFTSLFEEDKYMKSKLEEGIRSFEVITEKRYKFYRGIDKLLEDYHLLRVGIQFKFMGCDEDSYFREVYEQLTKYKFSLISGRHEIDRSTVEKVELLVEVYPDENYDVDYYDEFLIRSRYFKIVKAINKYSI